MLVLFTCQFREHFHHKIQIVNFIAEVVFQFTKDVIELFTAVLGGITEIGLITNLLKRLFQFYFNGEELN